MSLQDKVGIISIVIIIILGAIDIEKSGTSMEEVTGYSIVGSPVSGTPVKGSYILHFYGYNKAQKNSLFFIEGKKGSMDTECINAVKEEIVNGIGAVIDMDFVGVGENYKAYEGLLGVQRVNSKEQFKKLKELRRKYICIDRIEKDMYISPFVQEGIIESINNVYEAGTRKGNGVTMCVVDSGVDKNKWLSEPTYVKNIIDGSKDVKDEFKVVGHGTAMAGIIASQNKEFPGVAQGVDFMIIKVFDGDVATTKTVIQGIKSCYRNKKGKKADIMLLAIGDNKRYWKSCDNTAMAKAANKAVEQGVFVVAAAGNNGFQNGVNNPACASKVFTVGAVEKAGVRAKWSNCGNAINGVANGVQVMSLASSAYGPELRSFSGTSPAAAKVAGSAAVLLEGQVSLSPEELREMLYKKALPAPGFRRLCYGKGIIAAQ